MLNKVYYFSFQINLRYSIPQYEKEGILTLSESPAIHTVEQNFINMKCFKINWISSPTANASKVF